MLDFAGHFDRNLQQTAVQIHVTAAGCKTSLGEKLVFLKVV